MASSFEKYTDRSGNERRNQIWEIQSLAEAQAEGRPVAGVGPQVPDDNTTGQNQDAMLLNMIAGATHADFAQKVLNSQPPVRPGPSQRAYGPDTGC